MKTFGSLHRDPSKGKIAGVCAGIAEYFGMEIWLVRILTLTGFFLLAPPFFFVGYIAAWFVLEKKPRGSSPKSRNDELASKSQHNKVHSKGWHNVSEQESDKVMVKPKFGQQVGPPSQLFFVINLSSYPHLRPHGTKRNFLCRLLLKKKKQKKNQILQTYVSTE